MRTKNLTLINKVQNRFNKIYEYTDVCCGDLPLNMLDEELIKFGLFDQFSQFMESLNDDQDPCLTKLEYNALYECMHQVVLELRAEFGRLRAF